MNYLEIIPEEIYYIILEYYIISNYVNNRNLTTLNLIRKIRYKKLFSIKFPQLYKMITELSNEDEMLIFSYKIFYHELTKYKINDAEDIENIKKNNCNLILEIIYEYIIYKNYREYFNFIVNTPYLDIFKSDKYLNIWCCLSEINLSMKEWIKSSESDLKYETSNTIQIYLDESQQLYFFINILMHIDKVNIVNPKGKYEYLNKLYIHSDSDQYIFILNIIKDKLRKMFC